MLEIKLFLIIAAVRFRNSFPRAATWPRNCNYIWAIYLVPFTASRGEGPPLPPELVGEAIPTPAHSSPLMVQGTGLSLAQPRRPQPRGLQGQSRDSSLSQLPAGTHTAAKGNSQSGQSAHHWRFCAFSVTLPVLVALLSCLTFTIK